MATLFDQVQTRDLEQAIQAGIGPLLERARKFLLGDHWQGGEAWIGPQPIPDEADAESALALLEQQLVSRNLYAEVTERHATGVVGWEPRWGLAPRRPLGDDEEPAAAEQALIDEAEAALTVWWDKQGVHQVLLKMAATVLWADAGGTVEEGAKLVPMGRLGEGRAGLRFRVPGGRTVPTQTEAEDGTVGSGVGVVVPPDLAAALALLVLEAPEPDALLMLQDSDTLAQCGVVITPGPGGKPIYELYYLADPAEAPTAPGVAPSAGPLTVFRRLGGGIEQRAELDLGGRLPVFEIRRPLLCTAQVRQGQMALNLALTMIPHNITSGAFLETTLLNAQMPGHWEFEGGQRKRFVPEPYHKGPGVTNFVRGIEYRDETGKTLLSTPAIDHRPPSDAKPAAEAARELYRGILEEVDQVHVLLGPEADPSGRSREEARKDYVASLQLSQAPAQEAGRWIIEVALAQAEALLQQPGRWTAVLRAEFECRINAGPPSPEEVQHNGAEWEAGRISTATLLERNGIPDPDAELARMGADPRIQAIIGKQQLDALSSASLAGFTSLVDAGEFLGLPEEKMEILRRVEAAAQEAAARAEREARQNAEAEAEAARLGGRLSDADDDELVPADQNGRPAA